MLDHEAIVARLRQGRFEQDAEVRSVASSDDLAAQYDHQSSGVVSPELRPPSPASFLGLRTPKKGLLISTQDEPGTPHMIHATGSPLGAEAPKSITSSRLWVISAHAAGFAICLIDDCDGRDIPLVEIKATRANFEGRSMFINQDLPITTGKMQGVISSNVFNSLMSSWEPLIEPWQGCIVMSTSDSQSRPSALSLKITSDESLELNLTQQMLQTALSTAELWKGDFQSSNAQLAERTPFVPYKLINSTGAVVKFWCISGACKQEDPFSVAVDSDKVCITACLVHFLLRI